ncbi:hypothetical protein LINGRAHAP2_LOCUS12454 [Linum grandiflorum]
MASYNRNSYYGAGAVEGEKSDAIPVEGEKSNAIRDYDRQFVKLGRLLGASALLFGSLKTLPLLIQSATANLSVSDHKFVPFLVAIVIVLLVYKFSCSDAASSSDNTKEKDSSPSSSLQSELYRERVSLSSARRKEAQDVSLLEEDATTVDDDGLVPVTPPVSEEFHRYRRTESVVTEDFEGKLSIDDNEAGSTTRKSSGGKKKQRRPETVREKEKPDVLERNISSNQAEKPNELMNDDDIDLKAETFIETLKKVQRYEGARDPELRARGGDETFIETFIETQMKLQR